MWWFCVIYSENWQDLALLPLPSQHGGGDNDEGRLVMCLVPDAMWEAAILGVPKRERYDAAIILGRRSHSSLRCLAHLELFFRWTVYCQLGRSSPA
jgi:hypothetical protein